jgi:putative PIG3 family NAD(P)H quinone oxidoreductase
MKSMRAVVITKPGGPDVLAIEERPAPEPGPGQVRVRVRASALNRADIGQRLGRYPAPPGYPPDIPGLEFAGEVESAGGGSSLFNAGDRVMGIVAGGGHAELLCVHERELIPVPSNLSWEEAAAIPEVFLTAYDAMFIRMELSAGMSLLIHAVGSGVGTAAVQLARIAGIAAIGTTRTQSKLDRAKELGLPNGVITSDPEWETEVIRMSGGSGVNAILDLLGGGFLAANLRVLAQRGRLLVVGTTAGASAELDLRTVLQRRLRIEGTVLRARPLEEKIALAREFSARMLPYLASGQLKAVIDSVLPFEKVAAAHERMESNVNFGKIVLIW